MSLLHSPRMLICATLAKMFVDQFAKLNDEERLVVIERFCLDVGTVLGVDRSHIDVPANKLKSDEEN